MAGWLRQEVWAPADKSGIVVVSVLALFAAPHVNYFLGWQFTATFVLVAIASAVATEVLVGRVLAARDRSNVPGT
ncbi:MAG: hypothetical protein RIR41_1891, partial [Pseudomonadota bacterium]